MGLSGTSTSTGASPVAWVCCPDESVASAAATVAAPGSAGGCGADEGGVTGGSLASDIAGHHTGSARPGAMRPLGLATALVILVPTPGQAAEYRRGMSRAEPTPLDELLAHHEWVSR